MEIEPEVEPEVELEDEPEVELEVEPKIEPDWNFLLLFQKKPINVMLWYVILVTGANTQIGIKHLFLCKNKISSRVNFKHSYDFDYWVIEMVTPLLTFQDNNIYKEVSISQNSATWVAVHCIYFRK